MLENACPRTVYTVVNNAVGLPFTHTHTHTHTHLNDSVLKPDMGLSTTLCTYMYIQ